MKPGTKLCSNCRKTIFKDLKEDSDDIENCSIEDKIESFTVDESSVQKVEVLSKLNKSLTGIDCSPIQLHGLTGHRKKSYGKRKFETFQENVRDKFEKVLETEIPIEKCEIEKIIKEKSDDMDKLVELMQTNIKCSSRSKQIQLLTIPAALSWPRKNPRHL